LVLLFTTFGWNRRSGIVRRDQRNIGPMVVSVLFEYTIPANCAATQRTNAIVEGLMISANGPAPASEKKVFQTWKRSSGLMVSGDGCERFATARRVALPLE
jgi:hypothetical protein